MPGVHPGVPGGLPAGGVVRISRQIDPSSLMFGWNIGVVNLTLGGLNGKSTSIKHRIG